MSQAELDDVDANGKECPPAAPQGFLSEVFGGQLSSRVACGSCDYTSVTLEPFMDLSLPIPSASLANLHTSEPDRCTSQLLNWRLKLYIVQAGRWACDAFVQAV